MTDEMDPRPGFEKWQYKPDRTYTEAECKAMVAAACRNVLERGWAIGVHHTALDDMRLEIPADARADLEAHETAAWNAAIEAAAEVERKWRLAPYLGPEHQPASGFEHAGKEILALRKGEGEGHVVEEVLEEDDDDE